MTSVLRDNDTPQGQDSGYKTNLCPSIDQGEQCSAAIEGGGLDACWFAHNDADYIWSRLQRIRDAKKRRMAEREAVRQEGTMLGQAGTPPPYPQGTDTFGANESASSRTTSSVTTHTWGLDPADFRSPLE